MNLSTQSNAPILINKPPTTNGQYTETYLTTNKLANKLRKTFTDAENLSPSHHIRRLNSIQNDNNTISIKVLITWNARCDCITCKCAAAVSHCWLCIRKAIKKYRYKGLLGQVSLDVTPSKCMSPPERHF